MVSITYVGIDLGLIRFALVYKMFVHCDSALPSDSDWFVAVCGGGGQGPRGGRGPGSYGDDGQGRGGRHVPAKFSVASVHTSPRLF